MYLANTINFPLASKDKFEARFSNFKSFGSFSHKFTLDLINPRELVPFSF